MEQSDFLTATAQVAVGLAGFTGVAGVFSTRPSDVPAEVQAERLRGMIEASLVAVIFALVPFILSDLGLPDSTLWRLASALYLLTWTSTFIVSVRRGLRVVRDSQSQLHSWLVPLLRQPAS